MSILQCFAEDIQHVEENVTDSTAVYQVPLRTPAHA